MSNKKVILLMFLIICFSGCDKNKKEPKPQEIRECINEKHSSDKNLDITLDEIPKINTIYSPDFSCDTCFWGINYNDPIELVKEKLSKNKIEFEEGIDYAGVYKIWNKGMMIEEGINLNFIIAYYKDNLNAFTKESIPLEDAKKICMHFEDDYDVSTLRKYQCHIIKEDKYELSLWNVDGTYTFSIRNLLLSEQLKKIYDSFE